MGVALDHKQAINFSCNGVIQTLNPDPNGHIVVRVVPGKYIFNFYYDQSHYEITTDSILIQPGYRSLMKVHFRKARVNVYTKKPVIYVYPQERTTVTIQLNLNGELEFTYPQYNNGWTFTANPDGTIEQGDKIHHYLFWDGTADLELDQINLAEGFVVNRENLIVFFEEKLAAMGLNSHEIEDYITYWGPLMSKYENTYVHFMFTSAYDQIATLDIQPKPDKIFRVFMLWSEFKEGDTAPLIEQNIQSFKREGFSIVEWGGAYLANLAGEHVGIL